MVFDLRGHVPGGNWVTLGFNPPGPHFWGVIAEAQMCPKHCFLHVFCLPVSRDFAKKIEILEF